MASFEELKALETLKKLVTIFLSENPIAKDPQYRNRIIAYLPQITQIDLIDIPQTSIRAALLAPSQK